ncbi:non-structural maintenance of chromosomes element 1 homolog isoform X2 [Cotesia glomerata]|uniref:non-structural maintenance of chromosomes element 1 homolog isoform X2 n=1 Tax=Cotesia glomerata TaxID=32391 RepID=UPI001D009CB4|nr:non-structural maintenance of chromosomes element 1 homolog isoform X2 [Cotesia glomerata]
MANIGGRQDGDLPEEFQSFIQVMSQKGIYPDAEFKAAIGCITGHRNVTEVTRDLNKALAEVEMTIQSSKCEITGVKHWVFASTTIDDDNDQVEVEPNHDEDTDQERDGLLFTKGKLELLKMIISVILSRNDNNCISKNDCINLVSSIKTKLSRSSVDKFIKQMIDGRWLFYLDGNVYLGVRGIVELMPYLKSENPNLKTCQLCKQTVIFGQLCQKCDKKMHIYCLAKYFKISGKHQCPGCGHNLQVNNQFMARYSNDDDDLEDPSIQSSQFRVSQSQEPTPGPSTSRRSRRRRIED